MVDSSCFLRCFNGPEGYHGPTAGPDRDHGRNRNCNRKCNRGSGLRDAGDRVHLDVDPLGQRRHLNGRACRKWLAEHFGHDPVDLGEPAQMLQHVRHDRASRAATAIDGKPVAGSRPRSVRNTFSLTR